MLQGFDVNGIAKMEFKINDSLGMFGPEIDQILLQLANLFGQTYVLDKEL